jgi:hypothetical protein
MGAFKPQSRLARARWANRPGSRLPVTVLVLPSYSVGSSLLAHYGERIPALEHRQLLTMLMLPLVPKSEMIFVTAKRPTARVLEYYLSFVPADRREDTRARIRLLEVHDPTARSITAKLAPRISLRPLLLNPSGHKLVDRTRHRRSHRTYDDRPLTRSRRKASPGSGGGDRDARLAQRSPCLTARQRSPRRVPTCACDGDIVPQPCQRLDAGRADRSLRPSPMAGDDSAGGHAHAEFAGALASCAPFRGIACQTASAFGTSSSPCSGSCC